MGVASTGQESCGIEKKINIIMVMILRKLKQEFYFNVNTDNNDILFVFYTHNYSYCLTIDRNNINMLIQLYMHTIHN